MAKNPKPKNASAVIAPHQVNEGAVIQHKADVGPTEGNDRGLGSHLDTDQGRPGHLGEPHEAEPRHRVQQIVLVLEMAIGRRIADTGLAGGLDHGEVNAAALLDKLGGGKDQRIAQITVVIV